MTKTKRMKSTNSKFPSEVGTTLLPTPSFQSEATPSCVQPTLSQSVPPTTSQSMPPDASQAMPPTALQSVPPLQHTSDQVPPVQHTSDQVPPVQPTNDTKSLRKRVGRESMRHWTVNAIDSQGVKKKLRVKVREIFNIKQGERVLVEFNLQGVAIGEEQGLLAGVCGLLATNCELFPINFERWPEMPGFYFDHAFEHFVKVRFSFNTEERIARRYVSASIVKKWGAHRQKLWTEFHDPTKTRDELIQNVPVGIQRDQWVGFVNYRLSSKCKELCEKNAEVRKKQTIVHTGGSKPYARIWEEMSAETEQKASRGQIYLATHKKKDGSYVPEAKEICEKIEQTLSQSTIDESIISPDDAVGKVLGKEHSGRVRCLGLGATPIISFKKTRIHSSGSHGTCSVQCQENFNKLLETLKSFQESNNLLLNTLKSYLIMKEGTIPQEFAGIFASSHSTLSDAGSEHVSPHDVVNDANDEPVGRSRGSMSASNLN